MTDVNTRRELAVAQKIVARLDELAKLHYSYITLSPFYEKDYARGASHGFSEAARLIREEFLHERSI